MKIEVARFNQILGRLLSMSGIEDPAGDLGTEVAPCIVLEADRPEWLFLGNQKPLAASISLGAVAAQNGCFRVRNPSTSGVLAVVELATITSLSVGSTVEARLGAAAADFGSLQVPVNRDSRQTTGGVCVCSYQNNGAPSGSMIDQENLGASAPYRFSGFPCVLAPGGSVDLTGATVNVSYYFAVVIRERAMEPFEAAR